MIVPVETATNSDEEIVVDDVGITYTQSADCVSHPDAAQFLKVFTENNGVARFIVLKTSRWSINDIDDLIEILNDFKVRAGIK